MGLTSQSDSPDKAVSAPDPRFWHGATFWTSIAGVGTLLLGYLRIAYGGSEHTSKLIDYSIISFPILCANLGSIFGAKMTEHAANKIGERVNAVPPSVESKES